MTHDDDRPPRRPSRRSALRSAAGTLAVLLALLAPIGCDLPRDPGGTLARVRRGTMRVGVVEHRPWTTLPAGGGAGGVEGALVAELARELGARIEWVRATESQLMEALELHELDLVIGGFTDAGPWKEHVAFTRPIYTDTIVVGGPQVAGRLQSIRGRTVAVWSREPAVAAYVRKNGGIPRLVPELGQWPGLVAARTWQLPRLGFGSAGITLHEANHVIAAPPGENAWLAHIERSVRLRKPVIGDVLRMSP